MATPGPIEKIMAAKLADALSPTHIEIRNESESHGRPLLAESHFFLVVVSPIFAGLSRMERQRRVHEALAVELAGKIHALSLRLYNPDEWSLAPKMSSSPECQHGGQKP
jgi:BolA protein